MQTKNDKKRDKVNAKYKKITSNNYLEKVEQAKKHYERVIDTIQDGICVIDSEYKIQSWNKAFAERVGIGIKKIKHRKCSTVIPRYENHLFKRHCARKHCDKTCSAKVVFDSGKVVSYLEYNVDDDGNTRYHQLSEFPTKGKDGKVEQVVIIIKDVTEQAIAQENIKRLSEDLEKKVFKRTWQLDSLNKKLSKVLHLKSEFISDASHELRTPLTVIQGNLDIALSEAKLNSLKCPDVLMLIDREIKHISRILSDLTMLTNADTGFEDISYEPVDLELLIFDVQQSLKILAKKKGIRIIKKKRKSKELIIMGDELKLERLLLNIVRNAIKYTQEKGKIEIWTEKTGKRVNIHIKDNGIGIPEEDLPNIFERFYRVDKARSREEGGTGLGLSICQSIAEAHVGHISVSSEVKKGTEFVVHLPYDYKKKKK